MNTIKITIETTPETAMKVLSLIANEDGGAAMRAIGIIANESMVAAPSPVQTAPAFPQPTPAPVQYSAPVQQPVQTTPAAPTGAPAYSIAQLQAACAPLADAGKLPALQQLISTFGVASLSELPPARYGEFANGLRALGGVL